MLNHGVTVKAHTWTTKEHHDDHEYSHAIGSGSGKSGSSEKWAAADQQTDSFGEGSSSTEALEDEW